MLRRQGCRYLAQIASAVAFASADAAIAARTVMRDGVHYRGAIFAAAAAAIDRLGGLFSYSALHVRRNDLQYKGSFVAADATAANVAPLLRRNESVYIATDETAAAFFAPLEEQVSCVMTLYGLYVGIPTVTDALRFTRKEKLTV